jgi:hypothetical protein
MKNEERISKAIGWVSLATGVLAQSFVVLPIARNPGFRAMLIICGFGLFANAFRSRAFGETFVGKMASRGRHLYALLILPLASSALWMPLLAATDATYLAERVERGSTLELKLAASIRPGWVSEHGTEFLYAAARPLGNPHADVVNIALLMDLGVDPNEWRGDRSPAEVAKFHEQRGALRALVQGGARLPTERWRSAQR